MVEGPTDRQVPRLPGATPEGERRPKLRSDSRQGGMRAVGVAAGRVAAPIVAGNGGILARLKFHWATVAGAEFAAIAWPEALGRDGALKLRVAAGCALELQHRAPLLIERINLFFGRGAVARLVLVPGKPPLAPPSRPVPPAPLGASEAQALEERVAGIADPALRAALAGLGELVLRGAQRWPRVETQSDD